MVVIIEKHKKKITVATLAVFTAVMFFMFFGNKKAEANAVTRVGWYMQGNLFSGSYLPATEKIYLNVGNDSHLYEIDPNGSLPIEEQQTQAAFPSGYYHGAASGVIGSNIYWLGGATSADVGGGCDEIYKYTYPSTLEVVGYLPEDRVRPAYATYNNKIYLVGGAPYEISPPTYYNNVLCFDGSDVSVVGTLPAGQLGGAAAFNSEGKLIIFGGYGGSGTLESLDTILEFDIQTGTSTQVGTLPHGSDGLSVAQVGESIYVFLHEYGPEADETEIYEFRDNVLKKLSVSIPEIVEDACAIAVGTKIYLFTSDGTADIWRLDTEQIPPEKVGVNITESNNVVTLTWTGDYRSLYYHIERSRDQQNWQEIAVVTDSSFTDTPEPGRYYYRVRAESGAGVMGEYSDIVSIDIEPDAPLGLQASVDGREISLSWQAVTGVGTYIIQRSTNGTSWSNLTEVAGTTYTDTNTSWNTTYYYRAISKTTDGLTSVPSNEVDVTTMNLSPPAGLQAQINGTKVNLSWQEVNEATSYVVERSSDGKAWSETASSVTLLSYTDQNTQPNTVYYYRVKSQCSTSLSDPSEVKHIKTYEDPLAAPQVISGLTAVWTGNYVQVTWVRGENPIPEGRLVLWKQAGSGVWLPVKDLSSTERDNLVWNDTQTIFGLNCRYELRLRGGASSFFEWYKISESGWATGSRPMPAPGGLQVASLDPATISWDPISGASSYYVQYSTDSGNTWQSLQVTGTSATVVRNCIAKVRAGNHDESHWSGIITVP